MWFNINLNYTWGSSSVISSYSYDTNYNLDSEKELLNSSDWIANYDISILCHLRVTIVNALFKKFLKEIINEWSKTFYVDIK